MGSLINQNSFLLLVIIVWVIAAAALLRNGLNRRSLLLLGGVTVGLAAAFLLVRPGPASTADDPAAEVQAQIGAGKPVLLEFRSQN